ncbi:RNA-binding domain-containing protein [Backusella circina FSU 941]|nr:RNA-binding domain-containing protein [Backusella circina FSU 941]
MSEQNTKSTKKSSDDAHAKLTIFIRGLPFEATDKDLEDFFGEIGPVRKCFVVVDRSSEKKLNKGFGYVHYALEEDAQTALTKLKNVPFMGKKLRLELAKRKSETATVKDKKEEKKEEVVVEKKQSEPLNFDVNARLIVRNLPFVYREHDLRKLFEKYGTVHDVKLPRKYEGGPLRGFAFIQFETVEQGQAAMNALNASEHHKRTIAVDWSIPQTQFREIEESEKKAAGEQEEEDDDEESSDEDTEMKEASDDDSEEEEDSDEDSESDDDEEKDSEDEEDDESVDEQDEEAVKKAKEAKKTGPTAADGTTLFVRNLLFESTENDLYGLFKQWGAVLYAKITRDPVTKLSRGTGFVCMRKKEDAQKCLEEANALRLLSQKEEATDGDAMNQLLSKREKKKKGQVFQSVITPETTSGEGRKFTLNGRVLDVTLAVDRNQANQIKQDNLTQKRKEDKRNLYLMREGVIFADSPAAETMSPSELQKRLMSFSERKKLVSNNPSFYISKTRLSIRNLPIKVDETELKTLGHSCIQKFKNQVKGDLRSDLTKEEKEEGWHLRPKVKQAKIIRSKDRIDSATQKLRSKGYGFLEFTTHAHALAALRYLNNNPDVFDDKRLIVEFSLENKDVIDRRNKMDENRGVKRPANNRDQDWDSNKKFKSDDRAGSSRETGNNSSNGNSRGGFSRGGGRDGNRGGHRGDSRGGFSRGGGRDENRGGHRGDSRGGFSRGGGRGGSRGGHRGDSRGGFGRGGSRGGRGGGRGGNRGGRGRN